MNTLPLIGTDIASQWNGLYEFLLWLSIFFFVLVVGAMIYFAIKYRSGKVTKTEYITHHVGLEVVWIAIPTILLLVIFGWGYSLYHDMRQAPSDALEIRVVGQQWLWTFQYDDGRTSSGEVYVPMNRPVKFIMSSKDVLHGFFIPNFRVKQDAVPGMYTSIWFEAKVPGKHQVFCTEYCGTTHSGMLAKVIVLTDPQWKAWLNGKKPENIPDAGPETAKTNDAIHVSAAAPIPNGMAVHGKQLFERSQCVACHSVDGTPKVGPSLKGLYRSKVQLTDGSYVTADENYIRESIENPSAKIVNGFNPTMPPFKGSFSETEMNELVAYIKSLN